MKLARWFALFILAHFACVPMAQAADSLTLQLRWYHQFQFAGFYAAQEKGFYRSEGLDITLLEGSPTVVLPDQILANSGMIGIGTAGILAQAMKGAPLIILEPIFQHAPDVLISLEKTGIRKPSDLIGKTVMIRPATNDPFPGFVAMIESEGLRADRVNWIDHTWNNSDLISGKVHAMSGYITAQVPALRRAGVAVNALSPLDYGIDLYGDVLFTSRRTAKENADALRRFIRATARGWKYAFENEEEMITYIQSLDTRRREPLGPEELKSEAIEMRKLIEPNLIPIGYSNAGRWQRIVEFYQRVGILPRVNRPIDDFFFPDETRQSQNFIDRLLPILAILIFFASLTTGWILLLRKQVSRKTKALRHSNEIKSLFLANMSHEIRTPLTAILGFSELLKDESLTSTERQRYVSIIERTGRSLAELLGDILDLSKIEAEKFEIQNFPVRIRNVLSEIFVLMQPRANEKGVELRFIPDETVQGEVETDPARLRQILLNLLGNALKFTAEGVVTVTASQMDGLCVFRVIDTGMGIPQEEQLKLFQIFSQVDPSSRRPQGGTGLGLALSRKLALLMGGNLTLEKSEPGVGSIFRLEVSAPLLNSPTPIAAPLSILPPANLEKRLAGKRILIVDDCEDNQILIRLYLEKAGAVVTIASDGAQAIHHAQESRFDLILMDVQMPIMDGYEATRLLRRQGYRSPIVALTANAMKEDVEKCLKAGCDQFLTKPVKKDDLIGAIGQILNLN